MNDCSKSMALMLRKKGRKDYNSNSNNNNLHVTFIIGDTKLIQCRYVSMLNL